MSHAWLLNPLQRTLEVLRSIKPVAYWLQSGIASITEVYLTLWEQAATRPASEQEALAQGARAALRGLDTYARVFPFAQPCAAPSNGRHGSSSVHSRSSSATSRPASWVRASVGQRAATDL